MGIHGYYDTKPWIFQQKKRKEEGVSLPHLSILCELLCLSNSKDFAAIIGTALLASSVGQARLTTLGASNNTGHGELPMRATSLIPSCLGNFTLRNSHE